MQRPGPIRQPWPPIARLALMALGAVALVAGCGGNKSSREIPITAQSDRALEIFLEGRELYENLRFDEAREVFELAIDEDALLAQAHLYRAMLATSMADRQRRRRKAEALLPKISAGEGLLIKAYVAGTKGDREKRIEILKQLVADYPRDKRSHMALARAYFSREETYEEAGQAYRKAIRLDKNYAMAYNQLGYVYSFLEQYGKAEKALKNYMRLIPDEANPYDSMADLYMRMGRLEDALGNYRKASELNPVFTASQRKTGLTLAYLGRYDEARDALRGAYGNELTQSGKVIDLLTIAKIDVLAGDLDAALAMTQQAQLEATELGLPENAAGSDYFEVLIYLERGQYHKLDSLVATLEEILAQAAADEDYKFEAGQAILSARLLAAAGADDIELARVLAEEFRGNAVDYNTLHNLENFEALTGYIELIAGNAEKAVGHLKQGSQNSPFVLYYLGEAYAASGNARKARETFEKHNILYSEDRWYAFTLPKAKAALARD